LLETKMVLASSSVLDVMVQYLRRTCFKRVFKYTEII
jgi:hypothetical protein